MSRITLTFACILCLAWASVADAQLGGPYAMPGPMGPGGMGPGMMGPDMMGGMGGPPQSMAVPAPAPRLPPGVMSEGGMLFYNGKPYQEGPGANPFQMAGFGRHYAPPAYSDMAYEDMQGYQTVGCPNCGGHGCDHCGSQGFAGKMGTGWTAGAEILAYTRDNQTDTLMTQNLFNGASVFNSQELGFDYEAGGRVFVSYMGASGIQYQAIYLQPANFDTSASVEGPFNLRIPFPLAAAAFDYFGADRMDFDYHSEIRTAEANIIYPWSELQFLIGYRYLGIDENFTLASTNTFLDSTSDYTVQTSNQLNGAQIGLLGQYELFGLVNFDFYGKFGVMANYARQSQVVRDIDNTVVLRDASGTRTDVAFVSEVRAEFIVPLGPVWSVQSGYTVFFINRVALAPDQYDFSFTATSGTGVNQGNNLIMHGAHLGVTARW